MALIDSLRAGAGLINDLDKNRVLHAIAPYQGGLAAAQLFQENTQNQFLPEKLRMANQYQGLVNQFYAPNMNSEIAGRNANTAQTNIQNRFLPEQYGLANAHQAQVNQLYPDLTRSQIDNYKAIANLRGMGGTNQSAGTKDEMAYRQQVALDNPELNPAQVRQAAEAYSTGQESLPDGTPIAPLTENTRRALSRAIRSTTSSKLVTAGVQANQADVELKALTDHVTPTIKDLGTTYGNRSIEQLQASFSNAPAQQEKLGRIIGARSLQYAIAQLRNRIDMGEPGINATQELMENSGQSIDSMAPRITPEARLAAQNYINEGVRKALAARNELGIDASSATGNKKPKSSAGKTRTYNISTGKFE